MLIFPVVFMWVSPSSKCVMHQHRLYAIHFWRVRAAVQMKHEKQAGLIKLRAIFDPSADICPVGLNELHKLARTPAILPET